MPKIQYTVRTTLPTVELRDRFIAWLLPDHIHALQAGGAEGARVVQPDRPAGTAPWIVVAHYLFPSREIFDRYLQQHGPALRADNAKNFPPSSGVVNEREIAEITGEVW